MDDTLVILEEAIPHAACIWEDSQHHFVQNTRWSLTQMHTAHFYASALPTKIHHL